MEVHSPEPNQDHTILFAFVMLKGRWSYGGLNLLLVSSSAVFQIALTLKCLQALIHIF